jgi:hypothetical protein
MPVVLPVTSAPPSESVRVWSGMLQWWRRTSLSEPMAPTPSYSVARQGPNSILTGWASPNRTRVKGPIGCWAHWWRDQSNTIQREARAKSSCGGGKKLHGRCAHRARRAPPSWRRGIGPTDVGPAVDSLHSFLRGRELQLDSSLCSWTSRIPGVRSAGCSHEFAVMPKPSLSSFGITLAPR